MPASSPSPGGLTVTGESSLGAVRISDLIDAGLVRTVYQPVVDLDTDEVVGYEALVRGPKGSPLERPDALFAAARAQSFEAELDRTCRTMAVAGALEAELGLPLTLFVNVEPSAVNGQPLLDSAHEARVAEGSLRVVFEFTERELTSRPADVLELVGRYRRLGYGIALDDVGKDSRSLALIAFLAPDVIKLDMGLIQGATTASIARTIHAVGAENERSQTSVLAEGIETEAHRRRAIAMGAQYGQGWLFGHPLALDAPQRATDRRRALTQTVIGDTNWLGPWHRPGPCAPGASSFAIVSANRATRTADKQLLIELSQQLELQAGELGRAAVLLATFQHADFFTPPTAGRYATLAERLALVAAIGIDMPEEPAPGVRGAHLHTDDPIRGEWTVAVISPHFAAAFAATGYPNATDTNGPFEYAITFNRDLAVAAATALMQRVIPTRGALP